MLFRSNAQLHINVTPNTTLKSQMKTICTMKVQTIILVICTLLQASNAETETSASDEVTKNSTIKKSQIVKNCEPAPSSRCELCPGGAHSGRPGCEETGKHQLHLCQNSDLDDDDDLSNLEKSFQSCKRTRWDEDYLMMRLQGLCMLLAFLSLRSVKREKSSTESLFDQRKRIAQMGNATVQNVQKKSQEMAPLIKDTFGLEIFGDEETGHLGKQDFSLHSQGSEAE